jgi:hypothetical protein
MARLCDECSDIHVGTDLHHGLKVGQVRLSFCRVRVDEVGVHTDAVDGDAGQTVCMRDVSAAVGAQIRQVTSSVVRPVVAVRLGQEQLYRIYVLSSQFLSEPCVGVGPKPHGGHANGQVLCLLDFASGRDDRRTSERSCSPRLQEFTTCDMGPGHTLLPCQMRFAFLRKVQCRT